MAVIPGMRAAATALAVLGTMTVTMRIPIMVEGIMVPIRSITTMRTAAITARASAGMPAKRPL